MPDPSSFLQHFVILEEGDADGRPQFRSCNCPLGSDHFFDAPIEPAERLGAIVQFNVQYRDDVHVCLYTRFGRMHDPHLYSYIHPEGNGVGFYNCEGLLEEESGNPYPVRPRPRTGILADDLVDDLVSWWHVYGTSEIWEVTGEPLPLDLGAAAKLCVEHVRARLKQRMQETMRLKDRAWRAERETQPPPPDRCPDDGACYHKCDGSSCFRVHTAAPLSGVFPDDRWPANLLMRNVVPTPVSECGHHECGRQKCYYRTPTEIPRRTWPIGSPEPPVPLGFKVAPNWEHQGIPEHKPSDIYVKTVNGWRATGPAFDGGTYRWEQINGAQAENGGTPLIEVFPESDTATTSPSEER